MSLQDGFKIGAWTVLPLEGKCVDGDRTERVQPKSMDVLVALATKAPAPASREDLLLEVWGERAQSDEPLTRCIGELRRTLGDSRGEPKYIATIPKRGYQLLITPQSLAVDSGSPGDEPAENKLGRPARFRKFAIGAAGLIIAAVSGLYLESALDESVPERDIANSANYPNQSIAVLPFVNLSSDQEQDYFADGITEEILNVLARNDQLLVTSRSSVFAFKDKNIDIPTVAAQLNVAHILEGSVRKDGNEVRITAQLIDTQTDSHMWSQTFDRELDDIFEIQRGIAVAVAESMEVEILGSVALETDIDPEAYSHYLQALQLSYLRTPEAYEESNSLYRQVIEISPNFPAAWNGLSTNMRRQTQLGVGEYDDGYGGARAAAQRAIEIDPNYAPAISQLGRIAIDYEGNLEVAAEYISRANSLEPNNEEINNNAAVMAFTLGRYEQAIDMGESLVARDPLNPTVHGNLGLFYLYAGRLDDTISTHRTALGLNPGRSGAWYEIGVAQLLKGQPEAALLSFSNEPDDEWRTKGTAAALHDLGRLPEHAASLTALIDGWGERWPSEIAHVFAWIGESDLAFEWLEKAIQQDEVGLRTQFQRPMLQPLHSDPRWADFLERTRSSEEQLASIEF